MFTVGGTPSQSNAIIKNVFEVGGNKPAFTPITRNESDEFNNGYLWMASKPATINIEAKFRGMICAAWRTSTTDGNTWKSWGENARSVMDVRFLLFVRRANDDIEVIAEKLFQTQEQIYSPVPYAQGQNMTYGDNISNRNVYWTFWNQTNGDVVARDKIGGCYAKSIGNNMPDCFPVEEVMPPLDDNTFNTISAENVSLNNGDRIYCTVAVRLITRNANAPTDSGAWLYIRRNEGAGYVGQEGSYWDTWHQYQMQSQYFNSEPYMWIDPPSGKTSDKKFFYDARSWSLDRPSWIDGEIKLTYLASMPDTNFTVISPIKAVSRLVGEIIQKSSIDTYIENMNTDTKDMDFLVAGESLIPNFTNSTLTD